ncbi:MAG: hypothetical protein M3O86_03025 [Actinomycetota bacterium]|nr:hypothetical protein [Actinomycetota bacterium]
MRPEFLVDRSLGRHQVPDALRAAGFVARTLFDVYGDAEEALADTTWLRDAGRSGWAVLTADPRIRRRHHELAVVRDEAVRIFALPRGDLRGVAQAARFTDNLARMLRACEQAGPFIYVVYANHIERRYPREDEPG